MVIIIPTSQKLLKQAQRLKNFMNSTTDCALPSCPPMNSITNFLAVPRCQRLPPLPAHAFDKAQSEADMPKYLLLFGDCVWDNRMLTSGCRTLNPDDYLLCFESETPSVP